MGIGELFENKMEWQIKPPSRQSFFTGDAFSPGERIVCFLFLDESAEIQRADLRETEVEQFPRPESILGRWTREVKERDEEEKEARKQMLASTEELFLSLFAGEEEVGPEKALLQQVLALMLERKRVIRAVGRPSNGKQEYLHIRTKEVYAVPDRELDPVEMLKIQEQLNTLVL